MTIADKLRKVLSTKNALKQALIDKGVEVSDTDDFASYVSKIEGITGGGVPKGFTELQYLEKTSQTNAYVDLGYKANKNSKIVFDFAVTAWSTDTQCLFGYDSTTTPSCAMYLWKETTSATDKVCSASFLSATGNSLGFITIELNKPYTYSIDASAFKISGTTITPYNNDPQDVTTAGNLYIFRANSTQSYYQSAKGSTMGKLYSFKIYESDELVRDFVPAQRKDTLTFGLYDKVTGYFITPSASGFTGVAKE